MKPIARIFHHHYYVRWNLYPTICMPVHVLYYIHSITNHYTSWKNIHFIRISILKILNVGRIPNKVTQFDVYLMLNLNDMIRNIRRANIFSTSNLKFGYCQISWNSNSRKYSAFWTWWDFEQIIQSATIWLQKFSDDLCKTLNKVLRGYLDSFAPVYLDSIVDIQIIWTTI